MYIRQSIPFLILLLTIFSNGICAQKVERERRIPSERFPVVSLTFLESGFTGRTHQKLYLETGSSGTAYEAKFEFEKRKYSVKFNENGQWLDTEKEIHEDEILPEVLSCININLDSGFGFDKFKIKRIQVQNSKYGLRYEIEVKGKSRGKTELYEFLFEADGRYIRHEVILIESYTNEF
ncbi:MAG: hypothetical protein V1775_14075 [Bacteroidota bacterium]